MLPLKLNEMNTKPLVCSPLTQRLQITMISLNESFFKVKKASWILQYRFNFLYDFWTIFIFIFLYVLYYRSFLFFLYTLFRVQVTSSTLSSSGKFMQKTVKKKWIILNYYFTVEPLCHKVCPGFNPNEMQALFKIQYLMTPPNISSKSSTLLCRKTVKLISYSSALGGGGGGEGHFLD